MQEKLKGFWGKLKEFFAKMSKRTRIILACALGAAALAGVIFAVAMNNRPYSVLFTGLSPEEITSISAYLRDNGTPDFQVRGTDTILVPAAQEEQLKADLLFAGYPTSGFAYETYRKGVGAMSTDSDRQMAYLQDLQDRMAGVIRRFDGVKFAVVNIVQGEDRRYVLDSGNALSASASVIVTMQGGVPLPDKTASAIRYLVAHSVKGLVIDNIAISDSLGNLYSGGSASGASDASELKLRLEEQVDNKVRTQIMIALAPFYGTDNVRVAVSSTVDVNHTVGESTQYTLPDWAADGSTGGEGIIGSKVYDQEVVRGEDGAAGGVVGNQTNADINTYVENRVNTDGSETYIRNQGETNYSVDTSKQQTERIAGVVADVMVSVSINSAVSGSMTPAELISHVGHAAGIAPREQADKISILLAPFYDPDAGLVPGKSGLNLPPWAVPAAIAGAALLLVLLILLAILGGRRKKKAVRQVQGAQAVIAQIAPPQVAEVASPIDGADIMTVKTEKSIQLRQSIRKFAEENPEMAAHMLKNWLRGGEEDE